MAHTHKRDWVQTACAVVAMLFVAGVIADGVRKTIRDYPHLFSSETKKS